MNLKFHAESVQMFGQSDSVSLVISRTNLRADFSLTATCFRLCSGCLVQSSGRHAAPCAGRIDVGQCMFFADSICIALACPREYRRTIARDGKGKFGKTTDSCFSISGTKARVARSGDRRRPHDWLGGARPNGMPESVHGQDPDAR